PALFLSLIGGLGPICWTVVWLGVTLLGMAFVGAAGLWCSVRSKSSWRSLLPTLGITYVGGFMVFCLLSPVIGIVSVLVVVVLMIIMSVAGMPPNCSMFNISNFFFIGSCVLLAIIFVVRACWVLISAH